MFSVINGEHLIFQFFGFFFQFQKCSFEEPKVTDATVDNFDHFIIFSEILVIRQIPM